MRPTRRGFLAGAAATGAALVIGFDRCGPRAARAADAAAVDPFEAYIVIGEDDSVTVLAAHMDMGQGIYTGVATLAAEELDADWSKVRVEGAAGNDAWYGNTAMGGAFQLTGGSTATTSSWQRYREAGARARAMLVAAAAAEWGVPAGEIGVKDGILSHPGGARSGFGALAAKAAQQAVPASVELKAAADWTLIGNPGLRRLDVAAKSTGRQDFTIDVMLPGMLTAVVAHPPRFGGKVRSFDASAAKAVRGVVDVVEIPRGVAVVARNTWAAIKGRRALEVEWDESAAETRGSLELLEHYRGALDAADAVVVRQDGDAAAALAGAASVIEAQFEFPYLAHAALEPLNAVARLQDGVLEVWGGHQMPTLYQQVAAEVAGLPPDKVKLHVMMTGGGFGRRATPDAEIIVEAVATAKAIGWRAPVKVQWTREDDMAGGRYRPIYVHRITAGLSADGRPAGWRHRIVGQSIMKGTPFEGMMKNGVDPTSVEGASNLPYAIPDIAVDLVDHRRRRAGAVVALGRLDPYGVLDRGDDRPAGACRGSRPGRVPARAAAGPPAASRRARARRGEGRLGGALARGQGARHRGAQVVQHLRRPGRRDRHARGRQLRGRARGLRGRLRRPGQPRHHPRADGGRRGLRPRHDPQERLASRAGPGRRGQLRHLRGAAGSTGCPRSRSTSCRRPRARPGSASPACRRSGRRSPTPTSPRPASS